MGASTWDVPDFDRAVTARARCQTCGIALTGPPHGICGACASKFPNLRFTSSRPSPQEPELFEMETFDTLCGSARMWAKKPEAKLEFWENADHVGFRVLCEAGPLMIYMLAKGSRTAPDDTGEFMRQLFAAMGQPIKDTPRKSIWDWIRKPGL